jgi:glycosyltransferase involved in cell wall biosynthesis
VSGSAIACVIPALNAAPTIRAVVTGLREAIPRAFVVVVDDGSTDQTYAAGRHTADVIVRFERNRGKGAALRAGFSVALARGCDTLLTVDADGQHDPRYAPALVRALDRAELAIGARERTRGAMPFGRRITNRLSAAAVARCIGQPVADAQSGFRAMRATLAREIAPRGDRYEFETEFLVIAARRGHRLAFVPIPTRYPAVVPSQFRPVRDSARIVGALWRFSLGARS